jgi:hypothetical protein
MRCEVVLGASSTTSRRAHTHMRRHAPARAHLSSGSDGTCAGMSRTRERRCRAVSRHCGVDRHLITSSRPYPTPTTPTRLAGGANGHADSTVHGGLELARAAHHPSPPQAASREDAPHDCRRDGRPPAAPRARHRTASSARCRRRSARVK